MNDTLTPHDAARALAEAARYEGALQQRTEGLTWMVWALATPAIFLTYGFAAVVGAPGHVMPFLWVPWVAAGVATTVALWRSAALSQPEIGEDGGIPYAWRILGFTVLIAAGMALFGNEGAAGPLIVLGIAWAGEGAFDVWRMSRTGRACALVAGVALAAVGGGLIVVGVPMGVAGIVATVVSGFVPLVIGLWQTLRG